MAFYPPGATVGGGAATDQAARDAAAAAQATANAAVNTGAELAPLLATPESAAALIALQAKWLGDKPGEVAQPLAAYLPVPITAYGADPTNTTSSVAAITQALANHNRVFVPPGKYKIDKPILWQWPGRELFGVRGASIFAQTANPAAMPNIDLTAHIILGNCHPYVYDVRNPVGNIFTRYPVTGAVVMGQRVIPLTNQADADTLAVGEIIGVRDAVEFARAGYSQPDYVQWCRVRSKSGATLLLDRPVRAAMASALVSKVAGTDPYMSSPTLLNSPTAWAIADSPHIHDLIFEDGWIVFSRPGAYEMNLHDIECRRVAYGLGLNACTGVVRNFRTDYSTRAVEIKQSSHDVLIDNLEATYVPFLNYENNSGTPNFPVEIGERSYSVRITNSKFWAGSEWVGSQSMVDFTDCWNCQLINCEFNVAGAGGVALVTFRGHADVGSTQFLHSIVMAHNRWQVTVAKSAITSFVGQAACPISRVLMFGNEYQGVRTSSNTAHNISSYTSKVKSLGEDLAIGLTTGGGTNSECLYEACNSKWS